MMEYVPIIEAHCLTQQYSHGTPGDNPYTTLIKQTKSHPQVMLMNGKDPLIRLKVLLISITILGSTLFLINDVDGMNNEENNDDTDIYFSLIGRSFYIDSVNGNDDWDGRSGNYTSGSNGPWKSLNKIDSNDIFLPGDGIFLRRGREWRIDNPLVFKSEGS